MGLKTVICVGIFSCLGVLTPAGASPWGQVQGDLFAIEKVDRLTADGPDRRFEQTTSETYFEYGLTDRITFGGKLVTGTQRTRFGSDPTLTQKGVVDAELFVQRQYALGEKAKIAPYILYAPDTSLIAVNTGVSTGREGAVETGVSIGRGGQRAFVAGRLGTRLSLGGDADQLRGQLTVGRHLGHTLLLGEMFTTKSTSTPEEGGIDYDVVTISASAVTSINDRMRLQIGAAQDISGNQIDEGERVFVALWFTP